MTRSLLVMLAAILQQSADTPVMPYVDEGACPFECCMYRDWTAQGPSDAYPAREPRPSDKPSFRIKAGERVTAMTGVVITKSPGEVRIVAPVTLEIMSNRFPKAPVEKLSLAAGDRLYLFTPLGEGWQSAWFRGRLLEAIDAAAFREAAYCDAATKCTGVIERPPQNEWWVRVRNLAGKIGWVRMDRTRRMFSGTDACGG